MDINKKGKIGQFFCKHKDTGWYTKKEMFLSLRGEQRYHICRDCGKVIGEQFMEYEGMGFK